MFLTDILRSIFQHFLHVELAIFHRDLELSVFDLRLTNWVSIVLIGENSAHASTSDLEANIFLVFGSLSGCHAVSLLVQIRRVKCVTATACISWRTHGSTGYLINLESSLLGTSHNLLIIFHEVALPWKSETNTVSTGTVIHYISFLKALLQAILATSPLGFFVINGKSNATKYFALALSVFKDFVNLGILEFISLRRSEAAE